MREIKFRGKRKDGGWEHGCLSVGRDGYEIVNTDGMELFFHCPVEPETVGQFTGLKDKNGVEIYEGDVVNLTCERDWLDSKGINPAIINPAIQCGRGVIKWDFCAWMIETTFRAEDGKPDKRYLAFPEAFCHITSEVIGNIHDNPELLEGGEQRG